MNRFLIALFATAAVPAAVSAQPAVERDDDRPARVADRESAPDAERNWARRGQDRGVRVDANVAAAQPQPDRARADRGPERARPDRGRPDGGFDRPRPVPAAQAPAPAPQRDWRRGDDGGRGGDRRDWTGRDGRDGNRPDWNRGDGRDGSRGDWNRRDDDRRGGERGGWDRNGRDWNRGNDWDRGGARWNGGGRDVRSWDRSWRNNGRYDWQRYRAGNRNAFRLPRYNAPANWRYGYRRQAIGSYLFAGLFARNYWIADPWDYRLPPVYWPYQWVRYYDDALLIDTRSGYVVDSIPGIFWY